MEWTLDLPMFIGLIALGLGIGVLSGLFGVGGGFMMTPLLHVVFGVPYTLAVGSTLAQMVPTAAFGTWKHWKLGHVSVRLGLIVAFGGLLGSEIGVRIQQLLRRLPDVSIGIQQLSGFDVGMSLLFVLLLLAIGTSMWIETGRSRSRQRRNEQRANPVELTIKEQAAAREMELEMPLNPSDDEPSPSALSRWVRSVRTKPLIALPGAEQSLSVWVLLGVGMINGVLAGILGVGGAVVGMPLMIYVLGFPTILAVGTSSLQVLLTAIHGGTRYLLLGDVFLPLAGTLLLGSLVGVRIGAVVSHRLPKERLRRSFAVLVLVSALFVASDLILQMI